MDELKAKQSAVWGSAPYERFEETVLPLHEAVLERLGPRPGERVLDIAAGTGQLGRLAARLGADVTVSDFAPELVETARLLASREGVAVASEVADAESLPYEDESFDVVVSTFGAMFAPDHRAVARELARVCRPGARLALATWRPEGGVNGFFAVLARFQPPPPHGASSPFDWGREDYVEELLGDAFALSFEEGNLPIVADSSDEVWEFFSTTFGPAKALADTLPPERLEELHRAWVEYFDGYSTDAGVDHPRWYLLVLGRRR